MCGACLLDLTDKLESTILFEVNKTFCSGETILFNPLIRVKGFQIANVDENIIGMLVGDMRNILSVLMVVV